MTADALRSSAMEPGVRVIPGFQAGCNADACALDPIGIVLGPAETIDWFRWWGEFRELYIDAKLDAAAHNLTHHLEESA